jgi:hypothetical protein
LLFLRHTSGSKFSRVAVSSCSRALALDCIQGIFLQPSSNADLHQRCHRLLRSWKSWRRSAELNAGKVLCGASHSYPSFMPDMFPRWCTTSGLGWFFTKILPIGAIYSLPRSIACSPQGVCVGLKSEIHLKENMKPLIPVAPETQVDLQNRPEDQLLAQQHT